MSMIEDHDDYAPEEVQPGLPEALPPGEKILWQGSPAWRSLALRALHVRKVTGYWLLLMVWVLAAGLYDGWTLGALAFPLSMLAVLAVLTVGTLAALAWGSARSAIFTITDQRLIVRFGMALRMSLNLPFGEIETVGLRRHGDGTGDLPIALSGGRAFSWLVLWPFVRPWRIAKPEIMLRGLPDPDRVARLLSERLRASSGNETVRLEREGPATEPAQLAGSTPLPTPA